MFFIAYAFKGQVRVFAGRVKVVSHSSCRTSAIFKYFCALILKTFTNSNMPELTGATTDGGPTLSGPTENGGAIDGGSSLNWGLNCGSGGISTTGSFTDAPKRSVTVWLAAEVSGA